MFLTKLDTNKLSPVVKLVDFGVKLKMNTSESAGRQYLIFLERFLNNLK